MDRLPRMRICKGGERIMVKIFTKSYWKNNWAKALGQFFIHLTMAILLFCMIYPFLMSVWCAFKTTVEYDISKFYPTFPLKLSNVSSAFDKVGGYMFNTVAVAVFGVVGSLFIASLASFVFATMRFPGKKIFFMMVICLMMIPGCLTLVPQFLLYKNLNLNNKLIAVLLPQLTVQPIGQVFLLTMVFSALPRDLFNAAEIDGANPFQVYTNVAIPVSIPILVTQAIMQINGLWNDYLWPMTVISTNYEALTISAGLVIELRTQYSQNMPITYAGYLIASLPLVCIFLFGNKFYIQGLMSSSIKM